MTSFRIVVPAYKAGAWIERTVRSIRRQRYANFTCLVIDDRSPDDTYEKALVGAAGDSRIRVERAPERRWAMGNWVAGIADVIENEEDVIVNVDGDDWLAHDRVLDVLAEIYADSDVWLTYGSHRRWKDKISHRLNLKVKRGIARPYPADVSRDRSFREHEFLATHLRTYRAFLWNAIRDHDLRDTAGGYVQVACDLAFMYPMLEMAGADHTRYIHDMLYVYNNSNPGSEHRSVQEQAFAAAARLRSMPRYSLLERASRARPRPSPPSGAEPDPA